MEKIFAYGTLLEPDIQLQLFGRQLEAESTALLNNYRKYTHEKYPYILPSKGSLVEGKIIFLTKAELEIADRWEEVPVAYTRQKVQVKEGNHTLTEVWAYIKA